MFVNSATSQVLDQSLVINRVNRVFRQMMFSAWVLVNLYRNIFTCRDFKPVMSSGILLGQKQPTIQELKRPRMYIELGESESDVLLKWHYFCGQVYSAYT